MLLLLITVMIVDVIENWVFDAASHHSSHTGLDPGEQTNGKYGKQLLHVKANQIVVTVHFTQSTIPTLLTQCRAIKKKPSRTPTHPLANDACTCRVTAAPTGGHK